MKRKVEQDFPLYVITLKSSYSSFLYGVFVPKLFAFYSFSLSHLRLLLPPLQTPKGVKTLGICLERERMKEKRGGKVRTVNTHQDIISDINVTYFSFKRN